MRVYLPRVAAGSRTPELPAPGRRGSRAPACARRRPVVLVVDDDGAVREITATKTVGSRLRDFAKPAQDWRPCRRSPSTPASISWCSTSRCPGMNGARGRGRDPAALAGMPYLFVTGYADHAALANDGAVGEDRIVQKPFRDGELEGRPRRSSAPGPGRR